MSHKNVMPQTLSILFSRFIRLFPEKPEAIYFCVLFHINVILCQNDVKMSQINVTFRGLQNETTVEMVLKEVTFP